MTGKRKRGRPCIGETPLERQIKSLVSERFADKIRKRARELDISVAEYIRRLVKDDIVKNFDTKSMGKKSTDKRAA